MFRLLAWCIVACALLRAQNAAPEALLEQAVALQQQGDSEGAIKAYRAFLAARPDEVAAHSNLGVLLSRLGRFDEAIAEYEKAMELAPENSSVRLNLGLAYYKSGRIREAASEFLNAGEAAPGNTQAKLLLADCDLRLGHNAEVIALLKPVEEQNPDNLAIAYLLGTALIRSNQVREGQMRVDRILRNGDSAEARFLLGSQMFAAGDFPAAVKQLRSAIELNPSLPDLESYYGQALLNTGDPDAAAEAFRKELSADPNNFEANLYLAQILIAQQKKDEAEPLVAQALRVRPDSREARETLAELHQVAVGKPDAGQLRREPAPRLSVTRMASGAEATLEDLRNAGPVLLVFGSYTCPNFRAAAEPLNKLYAKYKDQLPFYLVYIREAHSTADWQSTRNEREGVVLPRATTMREEKDHAAMCVRKLHIDFPALLDDMNGSAEKAYAAWPSKAYLVDRQGQIVFRSGLSELDFKADQLEAAIRMTIAPAVVSRGVQ